MQVVSAQSMIIHVNAENNLYNNVNIIEILSNMLKE